MAVERDSLLDSVRGFAALGVIAVHTAFWSGQSYTPNWFQSLTLLVDVPLFFMLSGWGGSYRCGDMVKTLRGLARLWLKWLCFVCVAGFICRLVGVNGISTAQELFQNAFFHVSFPRFIVFGGSFWFMPVYLRVAFFSQLALCLLNFYAERRQLSRIRLYALYTAVLGFVYLSLLAGSDILPGADQVFLFYSLFWMLGVFINRLKLRIRSLKLLLPLLAFCVLAGYLCARAFHLNPLELQTAKFPPSLPYLFFSCMAPLCVLYLRGHEKRGSRILSHIGKNALFYYFSQGLASSLLYDLLPLFDGWGWFGKWLALFLCNAVMTALMAESFALLYKGLEIAACRLWRLIAPRVKNASGIAEETNCAQNTSKNDMGAAQ